MNSCKNCKTLKKKIKDLEKVIEDLRETLKNEIITFDEELDVVKNLDDEYFNPPQDTSSP